MKDNLNLCECKFSFALNTEFTDGDIRVVGHLHVNHMRSNDKMITFAIILTISCYVKRNFN